MNLMSHNSQRSNLEPPLRLRFDLRFDLELPPHRWFQFQLSLRFYRDIDSTRLYAEPRNTCTAFKLSLYSRMVQKAVHREFHGHRE
jgi:hypothetical protein